MSTATSHMRPRITRTSLVSACGSVCQCKPRRVPAERLKEVLIWIGANCKPARANSSGHQMRQKCPRESELFSARTSTKPASEVDSNFIRWRAAAALRPATALSTPTRHSIRRRSRWPGSAAGPAHHRDDTPKVSRALRLACDCRVAACLAPLDAMSEDGDVVVREQAGGVDSANLWFEVAIVDGCAQSEYYVSAPELAQTHQLNGAGRRVNLPKQAQAGWFRGSTGFRPGRPAGRTRREPFAWCVAATRLDSDHGIYNNVDLRLRLRCPSGACQAGIHHKAVAVLHQQVLRKASF